LKLRRVGSEDLAQRVVDLDPRNAKGGRNFQYKRKQADDRWKSQGYETNSLDAGRQIVSAAGERTPTSQQLAFGLPVFSSTDICSLGWRPASV
jgi:hypothetical protein